MENSQIMAIHMGNNNFTEESRDLSKILLGIES
jgi:hypothetical protein